MDQILEYLQSLGQYAPLVINAVKALVVLLVGWSVAGLVAGFVRRRVNASKRIDHTIGNFAASIIKWVILLIVFVAVLNLFGIEATSLVAILGAATLAIGMALQGTLSDLAAGFMLILFRPYHLGQYVEINGESGTVKDITLFFTELATPDNVQVIVPNGQAWGSVITNYSHHDTRRIAMTIGIGYDSDADKAMEILENLAKTDPRSLDDPAPWVRVTNLGDSSVDLTLRVWCKASDFWEMKFDLTKKIKDAFDRNGIDIPYPTVTQIRVSGSSGDEKAA